MAMHAYSGIPAVILAPRHFTNAAFCLSCADGPMPVSAWLRVV
jgi:hypothetical protein